MRYYANQTDWEIRTWDIGQKGFTYYWTVSTWSKSRKVGLQAARACLRMNRGANHIPRFTIVRTRDKDIRSLMIPMDKGTYSKRPRACTCAVLDNPPIPCARKYANSECEKVRVP